MISLVIIPPQHLEKRKSSHLLELIKAADLTEADLVTMKKIALINLKIIFSTRRCRPMLLRFCFPLRLLLQLLARRKDKLCFKTSITAQEIQLA